MRKKGFGARIKERWILSLLSIRNMRYHQMADNMGPLKLPKRKMKTNSIEGGVTTFQVGIKVHPSKEFFLIGSSGKKVKSIIEESGDNAIDIQDNGFKYIAMKLMLRFNKQRKKIRGRIKFITHVQGMGYAQLLWLLITKKTKQLLKMSTFKKIHKEKKPRYVKKEEKGEVFCIIWWSRVWKKEKKLYKSRKIKHRWERNTKMMNKRNDMGEMLCLLGVTRKRSKTYKHQIFAKRLLVGKIKMKKRAKWEQKGKVDTSNKYINQLFFVVLPLGNRTVKKRLLTCRKPKFKEKLKFSSSKYRRTKQLVVAAVVLLCRIQVKLNQNTIIAPNLMNAWENRVVQMGWKLCAAKDKEKEVELVKELDHMTRFEGKASFTPHVIILNDRGTGKQLVVRESSYGSLGDRLGMSFITSYVIPWTGTDGKNNCWAENDYSMVRQLRETTTGVLMRVRRMAMVGWLSWLPTERPVQLNQKYYKGLSKDEFPWDWKGVTRKQSPLLNLEDKVDFKGGGNDKYEDKRRPIKSKKNGPAETTDGG